MYWSGIANDVSQMCVCNTKQLFDASGPKRTALHPTNPPTHVLTINPQQSPHDKWRILIRQTNPPEICHVRKVGWCTDMCIFSLFSWYLCYLMARHQKYHNWKRSSLHSWFPLLHKCKYICKSADQAVAKNGKVLWSLHNKHVAARHHCHSENTWQNRSDDCNKEWTCMFMFTRWRDTVR